MQKKIRRQTLFFGNAIINNYSKHLVYYYWLIKSRILKTGFNKSIFIFAINNHFHWNFNMNTYKILNYLLIFKSCGEGLLLPDQSHKTKGLNVVFLTAHTNPVVVLSCELGINRWNRTILFSLFRDLVQVRATYSWICTASVASLRSLLSMSMVSN